MNDRKTRTSQRTQSSKDIARLAPALETVEISDGGKLVRVPLITGAHNSAVLEQRAFRGRNDDDNEANATWKDIEGNDWTQLVDTNFRVRFSIDDTNTGLENNFQGQLQYNLGGAGWNDVNATSSVVQSSTSGNFTSGDNTTRQLSIPSGGSFITPNSAMDDDNGIAGEANNIDFADLTHDFVEVEYCCQIVSGDVSDGNTIELRVVRGGGTVLDSYAAGSIPTVTVSEPAPASQPITFEASGFLEPASAVGAAMLSFFMASPLPDVPIAIASRTPTPIEHVVEQQPILNVPPQPNLVQTASVGFSIKKGAPPNAPFSYFHGVSPAEVLPEEVSLVPFYARHEEVIGGSVLVMEPQIDDVTITGPLISADLTYLTDVDQDLHPPQYLIPQNADVARIALGSALFSLTAKADKFSPLFVTSFEEVTAEEAPIVPALEIQETPDILVQPSILSAPPGEVQEPPTPPNTRYLIDVPPSLYPPISFHETPPEAVGLTPIVANLPDTLPDLYPTKSTVAPPPEETPNVLSVTYLVDTLPDVYRQVHIKETLVKVDVVGLSPSAAYLVDQFPDLYPPVRTVEPPEEFAAPPIRPPSVVYLQDVPPDLYPPVSTKAPPGAVEQPLVVSLVSALPDTLPDVYRQVQVTPQRPSLVRVLTGPFGISTGRSDELFIQQMMHPIPGEVEETPNVVAIAWLPDVPPDLYPPVRTRESPPVPPDVVPITTVVGFLVDEFPDLYPPVSTKEPPPEFLPPPAPPPSVAILPDVPPDLYPPITVKLAPEGVQEYLFSPIVEALPEQPPDLYPPVITVAVPFHPPEPVPIRPVVSYLQEYVSEPEVIVQPYRVTVSVIQQIVVGGRWIAGQIYVPGFKEGQNWPK